jgi:hypothetical protein
MKKIMHLFFLSCLKATELIEKRVHFKLSAIEKLQLKLHKVMCEACTKYENQSYLIEKGVSGIKMNKIDPSDIKLLKEKIMAKIDEINN